MGRKKYQVGQNSGFFDYDSWATKQLQGNYDERKAILLWKAEQLARLIPAHIHFSTALEVGCAEGVVINKLRELLQIKRCFGTDICHVFLSFGETHYPAIKFIRNDGLNLPFGNKFIDLIVLSDIIEHISELDLFLKEIRRVSKYGLLKVPLDKYLWCKLVSEPLGRSFGVGFQHPDGHLHEFSKKSCEKVLKDAGFKILACDVVYRYLGKNELKKKNAILKIRWFLDNKLKQSFPRFAHRIFGGNLVVFFETGE